MNTYQVTVRIEVTYTLDVQVEGDEDDDIEQAAFDGVDELMDSIPVGLEYTTAVIDTRRVVDFPKRQERP